MYSGKLSLVYETLVWKCSVTEGDENKVASPMICVFLWLSINPLAAV